MSEPRIDVLVEVAAALEELRVPSPMNGDASNLMLTRALNRVVALAGEDAAARAAVVSAVAEVQDRRAAEELASYHRLRAANALASTPDGGTR